MILSNIHNTPRYLKKSLVLIFDLACINIALTLAIMLRMSDVWPSEILARAIFLYPVLIGIGLAILLWQGIPSIRLSSFDTDAISKSGLAAFFLAVFGTVSNLLLDLGAPRTVPMIAGFMFFALSVVGKLIILTALKWLNSHGVQTVPVAIYGAGAAGLQLLSAMQQSHDFRVVALVDDNASLNGVIMRGLRVQHPRALTALAQGGHVQHVLLAIPSATEERKRAILQELAKLGCEIQLIPSYIDMIEKGGVVQALKPVSLDDLLGRGPVDLDVPEIAQTYLGRSVLVSGAGGSIGSELCRQLLYLKPEQIVLYEQSEFALYSIERELAPLAHDAGIALHAILGSVTDRARLNDVLACHQVKIVLHAAAYKHVPLVEINEIEGIRNNILGTQIISEAAIDAGVERFILVSTDKAVRPTNVMGATKRVAEMIIQDLQTRHLQTRFSMVRFGNVLGSSGSVIPLFREQIIKGGPVTLTDPRMTRFFMTPPEAARLVLLAGAYAKGGDTFVLDMGEPVWIADLARQMIELSGLTVRDAANPDGHISIEVVGLRPGEKLHEELLIGDNTLKTPHPKILYAEEDFPSQIEIAAMLRKLYPTLDTQDQKTARRIITEFVECGAAPKERSNA